MFRISIVIFLVQCLLYTSLTSNATGNAEKVNEVFTKAQKLAKSEPDSAVTQFKYIIETLQNGAEDRLTMKCCINISQIQGLNQNFSDAFEYSQRALRIAEKLQDTLSVAVVSGELGMLYREFRKKEIALSYFNTDLKLSKYLYGRNQIKLNRVSGCHFRIAMLYREYQQYSLALAHLDTCAILSRKINDPIIYSSYHIAEKASIYTKTGKTDSALVILHQLEKRFNDQEKNSDISDATKSYISVIYNFIADAYFTKKDYNKAKEYYNLALRSNKQYGNHNSSESLILQQRALCEYQTGNYREAFQSLKHSKEISEVFFGAKSDRNNDLIEIKNKYAETLVQQKIKLLEQDKLLLQQRKSMFVFRIFLISITAIALIFFLLYNNKRLRLKNKASELVLIETKKESREKIEFKNKELTSYTLKLIEKEEIIETLTNLISQNESNSETTKNTIQSLKVRSESLWDEFNQRFIEVNSGFYEYLQEHYPDLSATERKHCALIRLNFSGKEMAHLLGISVSSVHVSRYRLRKRFKLEKHENLTDFLASM